VSLSGAWEFIERGWRYVRSSASGAVDAAIGIFSRAHRKARRQPESTWIDAACAVGAAEVQLLASQPSPLRGLPAEGADRNTCIGLLEEGRAVTGADPRKLVGRIGRFPRATLTFRSCWTDDHGTINCQQRLRARWAIGLLDPVRLVAALLTTDKRGSERAEPRGVSHNAECLLARAFCAHAVRVHIDQDDEPYCAKHDNCAPFDFERRSRSAEYPSDSGDR